MVLVSESEQSHQYPTIVGWIDFLIGEGMQDEESAKSRGGSLRNIGSIVGANARARAMLSDAARKIGEDRTGAFGALSSLSRARARARARGEDSKETHSTSTRLNTSI